MAEERIPTGKIRRAAKAGGALAPGSFKLATTLATTARRDPEKASQLLAERHAELADEAVAALGTLRGGAMKIGQMASFLDVDFIPPEYRDVYQDKLAALRDSAPPMSWNQVKSVCEEAWGEPPESIFDEFEHDAAAAASIGQVHRAVMPDGKRVAVKVQYPEIADALEADLGTAAILARIGKAIAPGMDPKLIMDEIRERILEEIDYELEAQNQRMFARAYRGHPFAHVPDVVTSLSARRVMVSEWVDGMRFQDMLELPDEERGRCGEIIHRFFWGSMHWLGRFSADPHPGNYVLMDDPPSRGAGGRMAFIDFGSVKEVDVERLRVSVRLMMAAKDETDEDVVDVLRELGYVRPGARIDAEQLALLVREPRTWLLTDSEFTIDRSYIAQIVAVQAEVNAARLRLVRTMGFPPDDLMLNRMELGVVAVMGRLGVTRNWYRDARESWFGDRSQTELGRAEQDFWAAKGVKPVLLR